MKQRYLYLLMFSMPILLASSLIALAVFGVAAGSFWLFVAGDDAWPSYADAMLMAVFVIAFLLSALSLSRQAYAVGRRQESGASLNPRHALGALTASALLLLAIAGYQWRVGNIGPKTDGVLCADFCRDQGFAGSGMPPRNAGPGTCSCFGAEGRQGASVPIEQLRPRR